MAADGLTLEELRSIAADVGITPARIDEAARSLEMRGSTPAPGTPLDATPLALAAAAFSLIGLLIFLMALLDGSAVREMVVSLVFMAAGFGKLGYIRMSLPQWAEERGSQMDAVAERLRGRLAQPLTGEASAGDGPA